MKVVNYIANIRIFPSEKSLSKGKIVKILKIRFFFLAQSANFTQKCVFEPKKKGSGAAKVTKKEKM
ncbi:MAG: hypothetical protein KBT29_07770 [Prevotellaceae bacterium]|nr:hypothetical protein [Candidatus Minthosoma caballi]